MKLDELAKAVSAKSGTDSQAAHKVLEATFAVLAEQLAKENKVALQGLGTFIRKEGKEPGKSRTMFKAWSGKGKMSKEEKAAKKAKRQARKAAKAGEASS